MLSKATLILLALYVLNCLAVDPPPGLRPAKAIGNSDNPTTVNSERKVLPIAESTSNVRFLVYLTILMF